MTPYLTTEQATKSDIFSSYWQLITVDLYPSYCLYIVYLTIEIARTTFSSKRALCCVSVYRIAPATAATTPSSNGPGIIFFGLGSLTRRANASAAAILC